MSLNRYKYLTTALLCLLSVHLKAQTGAVTEAPFTNECTELSTFAGVELWQDSQTLAKSSCHFAALYTQVVQDINNWAPVNKKIYLSLRDSASGASYDGVAILNSAENLFIESSDKEKHLRSQRDNMVTFAHEYGHVIFSEWLGSTFPAYKQLQNEIVGPTKANELVYSLSNKRALLNRSLTRASSKSEKSQLTEELAQTEQRLAQAYFQAQEFTPEQNRLLSLISPYHELFADIIAVIYAEDPQAMRHSIEFQGAQGKDLYGAEARDFTLIHKTAGWNDTTPHYLLSPTRSYLYHAQWIKTYTLDDKAAFIKNVFRVLKQEIEANWNGPTKSPETLNVNLIKRFKN